GEEGMVGAVASGADLIVGLAFREGVLVQQDLLAFVRAARAPRVDRMLGADFVAAVVFPRTVRRRNGGVVFLDPPLHLGEQLRLQRLGGGQHGLGVGVLGLQVLADVGSENLGIAKHLLPVFVLQPGVI